MKFINNSFTPPRVIKSSQFSTKNFVKLSKFFPQSFFKIFFHFFKNSFFQKYSFAKLLFLLAWFVTSCSVDNSVAPVTNEQQTITTEILEDGTVVQKEEYVYAEDEDWGIDISETVDFPKLASDNNKGIGILKSQGNGKKVVGRWNVTWFKMKKGKRLGIIKRCFFVRYSDGTQDQVGNTDDAEVSGVTISPKGPLYYRIDKQNNTTATLSANVDISSPSLPQQKKVTWTSSASGRVKVEAKGDNEAEITILDKTGNLNAVTITATSTEDSSKSGSVTIYISPDPPATAQAKATTEVFYYKNISSLGFKLETRGDGDFYNYGIYDKHSGNRIAISDSETFNISGEVCFFVKGYYSLSGLENADSLFNTCVKQLTLTLTTPSSTVTLPSSGSISITGTALCNDNRTITYQWSKDGQNISGANGSSYTATSAGNYTLTASVVDDRNQTLSRNVTVQVDDPSSPPPGGILTMKIKDSQGRESSGKLLEVVALRGSPTPNVPNENLNVSYTFSGGSDPNGTWTLDRSGSLSTLSHTGNNYNFDDKLIGWESTSLFLRGVTPKTYTINLTGYNNFNETYEIKVYPYNEKSFNFNTKKLADAINKGFELLSIILGSDKITLKAPSIDVDLKNQWQEYEGTDIENYGHKTIWTYSVDLSGNLFEASGEVDLLNVIPGYNPLKKAKDYIVNIPWVKENILEEFDFGLYLKPNFDADLVVGWEKDNKRIYTASGGSKGFGGIDVEGKVLDFKPKEFTLFTKKINIDIKTSYGTKNWGINYDVRAFADNLGVGVTIKELKTAALVTKGVVKVKFEVEDWVRTRKPLNISIDEKEWLAEKDMIKNKKIYIKTW